MSRISQSALILHTFDYANSSQIWTALTREHGKVKGIAKGSKRQHGRDAERFGGGLEPITTGTLFYAKANQDLAQCYEWDIREPFYQIRKSWENQRWAWALICCIEVLLPTQDPDPPPVAYFDAITNYLQALANGKLTYLTFAGLLYATLQHAGHEPLVTTDPHGNPLPAQCNSWYFDPDTNCLSTSPNKHSWGIRQDTVNILKQLHNKPLQVVATSVTEDQNAKRACAFYASYIQQAIGRPVPSLTWLTPQHLMP